MLKVNMLGTLSFELNNDLLRLNLGQRVCAFTCYLVQFKGPHRRDHLIELFWGEFPPLKARAAFNNATWRMRQFLSLDPGVGANKLLRIGDDLRLEHSEMLRADTHELSWAANRVMQHEKSGGLTPDEETAIANSVFNYRGPFLEGLDDPWALPERARLHELCTHIQRFLVRRSVLRKDYEGAALQTRQMIAVDPLNEHIHVDLMTLLLLIGRQAEAIRSYQRLEQLLHAELGIKPMPETQRLAGLIRSGGIFGQLDMIVSERFTPGGKLGAAA